MADKNSVTVLKDGQLAVATVAQNGDIISEPSAISTTVLVQTEQGPQLAVPTVDLNGGGGGGYVLPAATAETLGGVKVGEGLSVTEDGTLSVQGGGGGGSVPTLTWFDKNTGSILDVSSVSGDIYEVFRNGRLMHKGFTQAQHKIYSANPSEYIKLLIQLNTNTASTWKMLYRYTPPNNINYDMRFFSNAISDYNTPVLGLYYGKFVLYLGDTGGSWNIASNTQSEKSLQSGITYDIVWGFNGAEYYVDCAEVGASLTRWLTVTSTSKQYFDNANSYISVLNTGWNSGNYYNAGSFFFDTFIIEKDGVVIFDGSTAVENTDFVNYNCTLTTQNYNYPSNSYKESGTNLELSEPLVSSDMICTVSM